jgi:hypothetical protein
MSCSRRVSEPFEGLTKGLTWSPDARTPDWAALPTGRHRSGFSERDTGFEPATLSLGNSSRRSVSTCNLVK